MYLATLKRNVKRTIPALLQGRPIAFVRKTALFLVARFRLRKAGPRLNELYFALSFVCGSAGQEYGVTRLKKLHLLKRIMRNNREIPTLTTWQEHVILADAILRLPRGLNGDVVECGAFNGASTASLSLVCTMTGRRLFVCDSFEGLPAPEEVERCAIVAGTEAYYHWQTGDYATTGGLEAIKRTVSKFGNIDVCQFVKGYFEDTLKDLETDAIVLVFEDADLPSSVRDCIIHLWRKLQERCKFYCHEPWSTEVVGLFYDKDLWNLQLGLDPPGFFGSGHGLSVGLGRTGMGYAVKVEQETIFKQGSRMGYPVKVEQGTILKRGSRRMDIGTRDYGWQADTEGERAD